MMIPELHDVVRQLETGAAVTLNALKDLKWAAPEEYRKKLACVIGITYVEDDIALGVSVKVLGALEEFPDEEIHRIAMMYYKGSDLYGHVDKVDLLDDDNRVILKVQFARIDRDKIEYVTVSRPE